MHQRVTALFDRFNDLGMIVPQRRAHLAGIEVQVFFSINVPDDRAFAALENWTADGSLIHTSPEAVLARSLEQTLLGVDLCFRRHRRHLQFGAVLAPSSSKHLNLKRSVTSAQGRRRHSERRVLRFFSPAGPQP